MTAQERLELKAKCLKAIQNGFQIAKPGLYIDRLTAEHGKMDIPIGTEAGSTRHLVVLLDAIESGKVKKQEPKYHKVDMEPKVAPEPKLKTEYSPEPHVTSKKKKVDKEPTTD